MQSPEAIASTLSFHGSTAGKKHPLQIVPRTLILAGWTGRDHAAREAHIEELALLGVPRPSRTPIFYRVSVSLLTRNASIQVSGTASTGEAEFILFTAEGRRWITVGSDHTDRKAEAMGVTLSKQLCPKPISAEAWPLDEVEAHWDDLRLRSYAEIDGTRCLYQDASVSTMTTPHDLLDLYGRTPAQAWGEDAIMFCGTPPVHGGIRWADAFTVELEDPVMRRTLTHSYRIEALPVEE